jgi:hypothetical protein
MQQTYGNRAVQRMFQGRTAFPAANQPGRAAQRFLQRMSSSGVADTTSAAGEIADRIQASAGGGAPLDANVQRQLEGGLGADLSRVRVHTDSEADRLSRSVDAVAFTSEQDIFFQQGAYNPHTQEGMRLLAHEATHTVQQAQGPAAGTPAAGGVSVSDPSDSFEQAAEKKATDITSKSSAGEDAGSALPSSVQRHTESDLPVQTLQRVTEDEQRQRLQEQEAIAPNEAQGESQEVRVGEAQGQTQEVKPGEGQGQPAAVDVPADTSNSREVKVHEGPTEAPNRREDDASPLETILSEPGFIPIQRAPKTGKKPGKSGESAPSGKSADDATPDEEKDPGIPS